MVGGCSQRSKSLQAVVVIWSRWGVLSNGDNLFLRYKTTPKMLTNVDIFPSRQSKLHMEGFRSLKEGEAVEFTYKKSSKGLESQRVTGPGGIYCVGSERRPKGKKVQKRRSRWGLGTWGNRMSNFTCLNFKLLKINTVIWKKQYILLKYLHDSIDLLQKKHLTS